MVFLDSLNINDLISDLKFDLYLVRYTARVLTFNLLIMNVKPLQTAWNQTRPDASFQAVCHSAYMSSKF